MVIWVNRPNQLWCGRVGFLFFVDFFICRHVCVKEVQPTGFAKAQHAQEGGLAVIGLTNYGAVGLGFFIHELF